MFTKCISFADWINLKQETISVLFGYNNFWQLGANLDYFTRHINSPFMHFWYISILMQFDLIFPFLFLFLKRAERKKKNSSIIILSLMAIISTTLFFFIGKTQNIMVLYYNTFGRSFSIILGLWLALMNYKRNGKMLKVCKACNKLIYTLYLVALIAICIYIPEDTSLYSIYMIAATIISTRLIRYSVIKKQTEKNNKKVDMIVKNLAKYSYEVYLVQYPVIFYMQNVPINQVVKTIIVVAITLVISYIVHKLLNDYSKHKIPNIIKIAITRFNYYWWMLHSCDRKRLYK